jgi:8-oxo-dGTP diphosphatase
MKHDATDYPPFAVAVDMVVLTIEDGELKVVLIERGEEPYLGALAIPGGFVRENESLDVAAARELREETKVEAASPLEQFGAYGDPNRDPRQRVVSVAYLAVVREVGPVEGGSDAARAMLVPIEELLGRRPKRELAFDHRDILRDAVERAREKLETTSLATSFVDTEFTMSELRGVYEAIWGVRLDPANFRRQVLSREFIRPTDKRASSGPEGGKPAEKYRATKTRGLRSPILRPR